MPWKWLWFESRHPPRRLNQVPARMGSADNMIYIHGFTVSKLNPRRTMQHCIRMVSIIHLARTRPRKKPSAFLTTYGDIERTVNNLIDIVLNTMLSLRPIGLTQDPQLI